MPIRCAIVLLVSTAGAATAAAEPTSDALRFSELARLEHMGRIDINPFTGEIAVGATGPGYGSAQHARIVSPDGSVRTIGDAIVDPDAVVWDLDGSFAFPGSVLVGGVDGIYAVQRDGLTAQLFAPSADLVNPEDMVITASGELLFADYNTARVQRIGPGGVFSTEAVASAQVNQLAVSGSGEMLFGDQTGSATRMALTTSELDAGASAFLTGLAFGDGSALWGDDAYAVDRTTGDLLRFGSGGASVIASGLLAGFDPLDTTRMPDAEIGFLPTGEMVIAVPSTGTIWTAVPSPASGALLAMGGLVACRRRR